MTPVAIHLSHGDVIDIGGSDLRDSVSQRLKRTLTAVYNPRDKPTLPDELLYDDVGLPIWNEIIFTPEFYQTHDEIALLRRHGDSIVARVKDGVTIVDIGAG